MGIVKTCRFNLIMVWVLIFNTIDYITTDMLIFMYGDRIEVNPLLKGLIQFTGTTYSIMMFKFLLISGIWYLILKFRNKEQRKRLIPSALIVLFAFIGISIYNSTIIMKAMEIL